jgi:hypothetical protein
MTQTCSCPAFHFKRGDAQCKHLAWLKTKVLGVPALHYPASHYLAYQRAYTLVERLYLLERVDKHGALAPLTVREALGVVAVRADDATVCPIDYLDLADPDLQPLRRCAAACGAAFHAQCITRSSQRRARRSPAPSAVVCGWTRWPSARASRLAPI